MTIVFRDRHVHVNFVILRDIADKMKKHNEELTKATQLAGIKNAVFLQQKPYACDQARDALIYKIQETMQASGDSGEFSTPFVVASHILF